MTAKFDLTSFYSFGIVRVMTDKKKGDQTVITPEEGRALLLAAHLMGDDETVFCDRPKELPNSSQGSVTVLNPFNLPLPHGPIIDAEAKPKTNPNATTNKAICARVNLK